VSDVPLDAVFTPFNPRPAARPARPAAVHPLAQLLAMEARPERIAVWAPDGLLQRSLDALFPRAEVFAVGCAAEAAGADAVVLAPTLARRQPVSASELARLAAGLPAGGLLAVQQQAMVAPALVTTAWTAGASVDPDFEDQLGATLVPLHRTEGRRGLGLWREVLWLGRKGQAIR